MTDSIEAKLAELGVELARHRSRSAGDSGHRNVIDKTRAVEAFGTRASIHVGYIQESFPKLLQTIP